VRRQLYLPEAVKESIRAHLDDSIERSVAGVDSAWEDEDSITGHWGGKLQSGPRVVNVGGREWVWSIDYRKFRGRGPNATESALGADGLVELVVHGVEVAGQKTALFQAKKSSLADPDLISQCALLSTWREAAFVILFEKDRFGAMTLDQAIAIARKRSSVRQRTRLGLPLGEFLGGQFIECKIGDNDLSYDKVHQALAWIDSEGRTVYFRCRPKHVISIQATSVWGTSVDNPSAHRMSATPLDKLGLSSGSFTTAELKRARRELVRIYHPDGLRGQARDLFQRRAMEINAGADELLPDARDAATVAAEPEGSGEQGPAGLSPPGLGMNIPSGLSAARTRRPKRT
jgi:hypothetical protein